MNCANLPEVMVSMARNRSLPEVLRAVVDGIAQCQNAVERAVILSQGGPLRFELSSLAPERTTRPQPSTPESASFLTRDELKRHERESIITALQQAGGRIFGMDGAAELLGMRPTTLASRLKALGIRKPVRKTDDGRHRQ